MSGGATLVRACYTFGPNYKQFADLIQNVRRSDKVVSHLRIDCWHNSLY